MPTAPARFTLGGDGLPDDCSVSRFDAAEALSEPYAVTVEIATADPSFRVEDCLRGHLCLMVTDASGDERAFDGLVDRARFVKVVSDRRHFEVRLVPALAALAHRQGSRIYQGKTVVEVAQAIFEEAGFGSSVTWRVRAALEPREMIVQYRESHLNFVSRLFEDEGIFYFFAHEPGHHTMIVADDPAAFEGWGAPPVTLGKAGIGAPLDHFARTRSIKPSAVRLTDYDVERPLLGPSADARAEERWPSLHHEHLGRITREGTGPRRALARLRSLRAGADTVIGRGRSIALRVGAPFAVEGVAEASLAGSFVVTRLISRGDSRRRGAEGSSVVENELYGIPLGAPFAPERRAIKPIIRGVQTAIVTGPSAAAQAIHVDPLGRIKVRFHWDRVGQNDDTSSAWIRVSQPNMGGSMVLPRVGWEVSVAFLGGDPDRPMVLGRVYNAEVPPPAALPAGKASGSLKSLSSPGGGGHNEIGMSDGAGAQGLTMHAQKDMTITIGHDKTEEVGNDDREFVAVNSARHVTVNETITVGGDQSIDVGAVLACVVTGGQTIAVGGNDTSNAIGNYVEQTAGDSAGSVGGTQITIANGMTRSVKGDITRTVGAVELNATVASISDGVVGALDESAGAVKVQVIGGDHGEQVSGDKSQTYLGAELHLTKGDLTSSADGGVNQLVGALHYQKLGGDYTVTAPMITLVGAVGIFKAKGAELKLGGGPVILKGSSISVESALIVKMGSSMKLG